MSAGFRSPLWLLGIGAPGAAPPVVPLGAGAIIAGLFGSRLPLAAVGSQSGTRLALPVQLSRNVQLSVAMIGSHIGPRLAQTVIGSESGLRLAQAAIGSESGLLLAQTVIGSESGDRLSGAPLGGHSHS